MLPSHQLIVAAHACSICLAVWSQVVAFHDIALTCRDGLQRVASGSSRLQTRAREGRGAV